ncbi:MAG: phosphoadenosine phosphosulfate reductase family protein [Patescibacteria group bacterium]
MTFVEKVQNAKNLIAEYLEKYPRSAIAVSFGKDSTTVLHLARQVKPDVKVFAVLSDTEFPEILQMRDRLVKEWGLNYAEFMYKNDPAKGLEDCCKSGKLEAIKEAVKDLDCWFSGVRRDEGGTRQCMSFVEEKDGLVKVNPILDFTEKDIWHYIGANAILVVAQYAQGYRSLSCSKCSAPEEDENEPERAGRWKGTPYEGGECGINVESLKP